MLNNKELINILRGLSVDQIEKAQTGHPGIALGATDIIYTLYNDIMEYDPSNTNYFNRDRFVLSAGHGSALLYSTLFLFGYSINIEDLKQFRNIHSITPGHPESHITPGVETTTGPLGQGVANSVGMAIAGKHLESRFNTKKIKILNNQVYCLLGDGCMMEGVSQEAFSLAGNLGLNNLNFIYDSNNITIDGNVGIAMKENISRKFRAMGFKVYKIENGNDYDEVKAVLKKAKRYKGGPTLTIAKTKIGYKSIHEGTNQAHGKPLTGEEVLKLKQKLSISEEKFDVPDEVYKFRSSKIKNGKKNEKKWDEKLSVYKQKFPAKYKEFISLFDDKSLLKIEKIKPPASMPMRDMQNYLIRKLFDIDKNIIAGTADVTESTKAYINQEDFIKPKKFSGHNVYFGIREHAMGAIANGIANYDCIKPIVSTYLAFSDYMRPAIRLSAIMNKPVVYAFTHDSVLIGQDGPTHQPVEHLLSFRSMPNIYMFRPANFSELLAAYYLNYEKGKPIIVAAAKQKINVDDSVLKDALRGGYIFNKEIKDLEVAIIASGSELEQAVKAKKELEKYNVGTRVISMPCLEIFRSQNPKYIQKTLPLSKEKTFVIEAGSELSYLEYSVRKNIIAINDFGYSATVEQIIRDKGLGYSKLVNLVLKNINKKLG